MATRKTFSLPPFPARHISVVPVRCVTSSRMFVGPSGRWRWPVVRQLFRCAALPEYSTIRVRPTRGALVVVGHEDDRVGTHEQGAGGLEERVDSS